MALATSAIFVSGSYVAGTAQRQRNQRCACARIYAMKATVKKTISLPRELALEVEETARTEGKTISAVIEDALRKKRAVQLGAELKALQAYGSRKAKEKGIFTEADLRRYLAK